MFGYDPYEIYKAAIGARQVESLRQAQSSGLSQNLSASGRVLMAQHQAARAHQEWITDKEYKERGLDKVIHSRPEHYLPKINYIDTENELVRQTMQREADEWLKDIK